ncbi:capsular polysaccharide export protein, LipB/KpsS family [Vibrio sinaloensis]|uniref:capsular polysaccharide export protein, LipB/KpsS family n=1 Tax=Photobacterium sp. (strain ATCC 43367) TaxID=379097 RepID=UPI0035E78C03
MEDKKDFTLLSLDPMYSSLHERIAFLVAKKKYAITSCLAKKVYLPTFEVTLATELINRSCPDDAKRFYDKIFKLESYHHVFVKKKLGRNISDEEVKYMSLYYASLRQFIIDKGINLVLIHNETRWYHAIAIDICQDLGVRYLVTEQGLIRPYTTIIDPRGTSKNCTIDFINKTSFENKSEFNFYPKCKHDSLKSIFFFFIFLAFFTLERWNSNKTILRYMHNNYSLRKYGLRIMNKLKIKNNNISRLEEKSILLLLQLDYDSQFLIHSPFSNNDQVISEVENLAKKKNYKLAIKKHPLDTRDYRLGQNSYFAQGGVLALAKQAEAVFTVNSSASIEVLKTSKPLLMLGESLYDYEGITTRVSKKNQDYCIELAKKKMNPNGRNAFIDFLLNEYLILGAGYSYSDDILAKKLNVLLNNK